MNDLQIQVPKSHSKLLWFLLLVVVFLFGSLFSWCCVNVWGFLDKPLRVAVVSAPIEVHLYLESKPGTNIWPDRKIWELRLEH